MYNLELAWDTYDFYTAKAQDLENKHESLMEYFHNFLKSDLNPSQTKKSWLRNKINKSFNKLLNIHVKQISAVSDLLKVYTYYRVNGITIPQARRLKTQYLVDLKNITATLIEKTKLDREAVNEILR